MVAWSRSATSSGSIWPCCSRARSSSASVIPACTVIVWSSGAYSTTSSSAVVQTAVSSARGALPRSRCVAPPTNANGLRSACRSRTVSASSSMLRGMTTSRGVTPAMLSVIDALGYPEASSPPVLRARSSAPRLAAQFRRVRGVHPGPVAAEPRRREHLVRIEPLLRVERRAHRLHRRQIVFAELLAEVADLVVADAVLADHRAAVTQADAQDLTRDLLGVVLLSGDSRVVQHQREIGRASCRERV